MLRSVSTNSDSSVASHGSVPLPQAWIFPEPAPNVSTLLESLFGYLKYDSAPLAIGSPLARELPNRVCVIMRRGGNEIDARIRGPWKRFLRTGGSDEGAVAELNQGLRLVLEECVNAELSSFRSLLAAHLGKKAEGSEDRESLVAEIQKLFNQVDNLPQLCLRWEQFCARRAEDDDSLLLPSISRLREIFTEQYFPESDTLFLSSDSESGLSDADEIDSPKDSSVVASSPSDESVEYVGPHESLVLSPDSNDGASSGTGQDIE